MRYIPHTESDIREMLSRIGIRNVEDLFEGIPDSLKLEKPLNLPAALPEADMVTAMNRLQKRNMDMEEHSVFLGAGAYRHFSPSLINHLILRGEFATSYTPYQPEVSQGTLQAIFEYQTMICLLTGMEIANASLYDGASGLAEAVLMAHRVHGGNEVLISRTVHPEYRQTVATYTRGLPLKRVEIPFQANGQTDLAAIRDRVSDDTCAVVLQSPNFFGVVEQYADLAAHLRDKKVMLIVVVAEATSLGILQPPGARGADIAVGEAQAFGLPVSFGGPYVGFFATREPYFRQVPGRIVGQTVDREGRRAYALTLATREQHIRREKATSNICTNQGLCALAVTIYLSAVGKQGLREVAVRNLQHADYLKNKMEKLEHFRLRFDADTYNEFVLECPRPAGEIQEALLQEKIVAGLPLGGYYSELNNCLLMCATEMTTRDEMDRLADCLAAL